MILMDRGVQKAIIVDLIGDGDGGDREEAKNQSLDLRQYHDDDDDDDDIYIMMQCLCVTKNEHFPLPS